MAALAGLYLAGIGPFAKKSGGGPTASGPRSFTFLRAAGDSAPIAAAAPEGPWTLVGGTGSSPGRDARISPEGLVNESLGGRVGCAVDVLSNAPVLVDARVGQADLPNGTASVWTVEYSNRSGGLLLVSDNGSRVFALARLSVSGACDLPGGYSTGVPAAYLDSDRAGPIAASAGAGAFDHAHPNASWTLTLTGAYSLAGASTGPEWTFASSNCREGATAGETVDGLAGASFESVVNATSGAVLSARSVPSTCTAPGTGGGSTTGTIAFQTAANDAAPVASTEPNGPWGLWGGGGIVPGVPVNLSTAQIEGLNSSYLPPGCQLSLLPGAPSNISTSAVGGARANGTAPVWLILYASAPGGLLGVVVTPSAATAALRISGTGTCALLGSSARPLPGDVLDSPAIAAAAALDGGGAFLSAHPEATLTLTVIGGVSLFGISTAPTWQATYSTCDPSSRNGSTVDGQPPAQWQVVFNATSAAKISAQNSSTACPRPSAPGPTNLSAALWLYPIPEQNVSGSRFWNNVSVVSANASLTLDNLTFGLVGSVNGSNVSTIGVSLQFDDPNGSTLATYNWSSGGWTTGGLRPILSLDSFVLVCSVSLRGDSLTITARASAPVVGSLTVVLGT